MKRSIEDAMPNSSTTKGFVGSSISTCASISKDISSWAQSATPFSRWVPRRVAGVPLLSSFSVNPALARLCLKSSVSRVSKAVLYSTIAPASLDPICQPVFESFGIIVHHRMRRTGHQSCNRSTARRTSSQTTGLSQRTQTQTVLSTLLTQFHQCDLDFCVGRTH